MDSVDPSAVAAPAYGATELFGGTDSAASFYMKNILNMTDHGPSSSVASPADYAHQAPSAGHGYSLPYSGYGNQNPPLGSCGGLYQTTAQTAGLTGSSTYYPDGCSPQHPGVTSYAGVTSYGTSYPGVMAYPGVKSSCVYNGSGYAAFSGNSPIAAPYQTSLYDIEPPPPVPTPSDGCKPPAVLGPHPAYRDACSPTRQRIQLSASLCSLPGKDSTTHTGEWSLYVYPLPTTTFSLPLSPDPLHIYNDLK